MPVFFRIPIVLLAALGWLTCVSALCQQATTAELQADVVIVGGSSSGIGAALGAARLGADTLLVEDTPVLGGMLANGISNIDSYSYESLGGVFEEFRLAVKEHYNQHTSTANDPFFQPRPYSPRHLDGRAFPAHQPWEGGRWEPGVADQIFKRMAAAHSNLRILYRTRLVGVDKTGNTVRAILVKGPEGITRIAGKAFVDATHEGDLAAWAGAPYRLGREPRSAAEPHAGHIYYFNLTGEILPGSTGRGDQAIPSSGLRLSVRRYPPNSGDAHLLKAPPPGYSPDKYKLSPGGVSTELPGRKFEVNVNPVGSELQQVNWEWPEATHQRRRELYEIHRNHALGYLYYLQQELNQKDLGLSNDEFVENANLPWRVFLREGRRIEGDQMMDETDVNPFLQGSGLLPRFRPNSIAVGHYPIDAKPVTPKTDTSTPDKGEGDFYLINVSTAFQVPYGAILPRNVEGLLVPTALSATHVAFSAVRMDPTWTVLGQAAGVAAALAAKRGVPPRQVPVTAVQKALLKQHARLVFYWDLPLTHPAFEAIQTLSLKEVIRGYPDRMVRPDAPLTRAEMAAMLVRYCSVWPSVSDWHFGDVPYTHWAFRDVETLHDRGLLPLLGYQPRWPEAGGYQPGRHAGFQAPEDRRSFRPEDPATRREFLLLLEALTGQTHASDESNNEARSITRAEAAQLLAATLSNDGVQP